MCANSMTREDFGVTERQAGQQAPGLHPGSQERTSAPLRVKAPRHPPVLGGALPSALGLSFPRASPGEFPCITSEVLPDSGLTLAPRRASLGACLLPLVSWGSPMAAPLRAPGLIPGKKKEGGQPPDL